MKPRYPSLAWLGAAGLLVGCQGSGSFAKLQESIAGIEQKQDAILAKLDTLEQKIGNAPAAGPQKPGADKGPRPGQPDPKVTYKVPVSGWSKGPDDAKVTIVEWSDFQ
ncbi:MAG: hypothetical protein IPH07_02670 [Deltaproteobacteria bacterium]|nr:hypothetical protein [Deltaproteobacteria bacterium]MBK8238084.1 hypothetical protein [Deltaproteobacteria bacterium]MBK8718571.1 hypothetical protein [Deltaproteobacteria bacterium]MBP7290830.1 hypothetical protein [Nannocystaceae bacterium]